MQFDNNVMKKLLLESDDALWETIRRVATENGITLPSGQPSAADMAKLRAIMAGKGAKDVGEAMEILRRARQGQ